jgi:hypothetical protein
MKYLSLIAGLAVIYFVLARHTPVSDVKEAMSGTEAAPLTQGPRDPAPRASDPFKQPLDRTHAVLDQVKARNGTGEF